MPKRKSSRREEVASKLAAMEKTSRTDSENQEMHRTDSQNQEVNSGDCTINQLYNPDMVDTCTRSILTAHVSASVKSKIWANEFIDLELLLKKCPGSAPKQKIQLIGGELVMSPKVEEPKISERIEPWSDAFVIFMSIYIEKYPNEIQNLLQYFHNIRLAAEKFSGWSNYDRQFRLKKSIYASILWQNVDPELWMLSMQPINKGQVQVLRKQCYVFNQRGFCVDNSCSYAHLCLKCQGQHPSFLCNRIVGETGHRPFRPYTQRTSSPPLLRPRYPGTRFRQPYSVPRSSGGQRFAIRPMDIRQNPY